VSNGSLGGMLGNQQGSPGPAHYVPLNPCQHFPGPPPVAAPHSQTGFHTVARNSSQTQKRVHTYMSSSRGVLAPTIRFGLLSDFISDLSCLLWTLQPHQPSSWDQDCCYLKPFIPNFSREAPHPCKVASAPLPPIRVSAQTSVPQSSPLWHT
jgi:hypothetical protein